MPRSSPTSLFFAAGLALALGCAGPNAQVSQIKADNEKLISTVKTQKEEQAALLKKAASLEQRLDQSEKEIARLTGRKGSWDEESRTASSKNSSLPVPSSEAGGRNAHHPLPIAESRPDILAVPKREEKLPWRAPASPATVPKPSTPPPKEPAGGSSTKTTSTPASSASLRTLAQRDTRLQYDAATDTARYQQEILFESSGAALTSVGRKRLDELATWLKADQTKDLRILISSWAAKGDPQPSARPDSAATRAAAVADYLGTRGIPEDRLVLVGPGSPARLLEAPSGGPVQIHLALPSAPILAQVARPALRR
jgi:outer membrane protein OmpA-like peptidoglycan-associated protein